MSEYILEARDVEYKYPDGTKALNKLTLTVPEGKKIALLGSNGAGKSTLFLHFNGILRPSRGNIFFSGRPLRYDHSALMELRKNVGIVFQDPDTQLFSASVIQEISFGPLNMGLPEREVLERVNRAMEYTETTHLKSKPTHFLSYGQKKRVSIGDILAMDPRVIIFDEPTACLDPRLSSQMMELFDRLSGSGKTVILSTHDVDAAFSWADYIYVMKDGAVAGEGSPEEVFRDEGLLAGTDLEKPWLVEIYEELQKKGWLDHGAPVPRTRQELFNNIPDREISGQGSPIALRSGGLKRLKTI